MFSLFLSLSLSSGSFIILVLLGFSFFFFVHFFFSPAMVYDGVARCRPSAPGAKKKGKRLARNSVGTSFFFKSINTFFMCFFFTLPPPRPRSVTAIFRHTRDGQFSLSSAAEVLLLLLLLLLLRRIPPLFYSAAVSFFLRPRAFRSPSVFSHAAIVRRRAEPSGFCLALNGFIIQRTRSLRARIESQLDTHTHKNGRKVG